jgi:hypothetical protein
MCATTGMPASTTAAIAFRAFGAAFEFHGLHPRFLDEASRRADRVLRRRLVRAEREIADEQSALRASADGAAGRDHLVKRDGDRAVVAEDVRAERVADQHEVRDRIDELARDRVVRRDRDDLRRALHRAQLRARESFRRLRRGSCAHRILPPRGTGRDRSSRSSF